MDVCLDENALADLAAQRLAGSALRDALSHIETCSACRAAATLLGALAPYAQGGVRDRVGPGANISGYELEHVAGEGGTSVVWHARKDGECFAIKVLKHEDEEARRRIVREARLAAAIDHPAIVAAKETLSDERNVPFALVFSWIEGRPLDACILHGPFSPARATPILRALADAVRAAHARGVVHRDLSPRNILLTPDDAPRVLDFGLARAFSGDLGFSSSLTASGARIGTPAYMAPEQTRGERAGPAADIWALGAIAYEMLSGSRAVEGKNLAQIFRFHTTRTIVPLHERARIPRELADVVMAALDPRAEARSFLIS